MSGRRFVLATPEDTHSLGTALGRLLSAGDLVVLTGGLGAGKTALARGIGEGLGVRGDVTSPTFVIARVHPGAADGPALVHVDAYRLHGALELDDLDLDALVAESVTVVEWGHGLVEGLADDRIEVVLDEDPSTEVRVATISGLGGRWSLEPSALATLGGRPC